MAFERIEHFHRARDHSVVLHALVVVAHLLEHKMQLAAQRLGFFAQRSLAEIAARGFSQRVRMLSAKRPNALQETVAALHRAIVPLQRRFGRRGKHGVKPRGVCAVFIDQLLRINAVVFGLGHSCPTLISNWQAVVFSSY
ncbi:MAG: hypothetical protein HC858_09320 [Brachymonas sp.]|nr:hypothetical protein [Brachymonas sp.]